MFCFWPDSASLCCPNLTWEEVGVRYCTKSWNRSLRIHEQASLIASGTQMAAWTQKFTLFSLMQGQLASGSESSIGCSAKFLSPPSSLISPPLFPLLYFLSSQPLSLYWTGRHEVLKSARRSKQAGPRGHSLHVKCTVPVFPQSTHPSILVKEAVLCAKRR